jgi:flagellar hook-associated protein 2
MVMRISGINSGLDIDKMVSDLMKAERMPQDKLKQKKTTLTWTTELYREINAKLASFKNIVSDMRLSGDWKLNTASSSNSNAVTVSADATASAINHSIIIHNLASGATVSSSAGISKNELIAPKAPTSTITAGVNDQFTVNLGGTNKTITLNSGTYTASELVTEIQNQLDNAFGNNKIQVSLNAGKFEFQSVGTPGNEPQLILSAVPNNTGLTALGLTDGQSNKLNPKLSFASIASQFGTALTYGDFILNGVTITYSSSDSLKSIMDKVNNSNAGVTMSYDEVADRIVFATKGTGSTAKIDLQNGSTGNFLSAFQLSAGTKTGTDAKVTIDGVTSYRSSNTFTTGGVTYTLKDVSTDPVTVQVSADVDKIVDKIKNFVTQYNDLVNLLNTRVKEIKYRDYAPLTDDQKKGMSSDEIKLWEDKAKSGLLHNDDILKSTINDLRLLTSTSVASSSSAYNALYKMGISTMPYNASAPQDSGKLVIDEAELRKALSADPSGVIAAFSNQPDGIAQQMYTRLDKSISEISKKAGSANLAVDNVTTTIGNQIHDLDVKIAAYDVRLAKREDYYYQMFSKMDAAVGNSNAQLSWLYQQFG